MKRLTFALAVLLALSAVPALAQSGVPAPQKPADPPMNLGISPGEITATPEMWFYQQQMQQYQDPKAAVRQKAEFRAAQRQRRMASLKWFGFSNQRPKAGSDPYHGEYSPSWSGPNDNYPFRWYGNGRPWVVGRPAVSLSRLY